MPLLRLLLAVALTCFSCAEAAGLDPNNGGGANHWKRDMQTLRNEPKQKLEVRTDIVVEPGKDKIMLALYLKDLASEKKGCPETSSQFSSPENALPGATSSDVRTISGDFFSMDNADADFNHVFKADFDLSQISAPNMNKMFLVCFYDASEKEVLALRATSTDEGMQILVTGAYWGRSA
jgi:hypothetical protein